MIRLGGASFIHNGIKQDYHFKETVACLADLCDEVVIVDAGSDDGTYEELAGYIDKLNKEFDTSYTKIKLLRFSNAEWHEQKGREKLSYFSNKAIEALSTDWFAYVQMDEVIHEDDFQTIRNAIHEAGDHPNIDAIFCRRLNLWKNPMHMLNVEQQRKPVSTEVVRIARRYCRCYDDAEQIACDYPVVYNNIDDIQIFHTGFVRDKVKHLEKIRHMQTEVFLWGDYDEKAKNCEEFQPDRWFDPEKDLIPIPRPLPKYITAWAKERYPSL